MSHFMAITMVVFIATILGSVFYWHVVRPVFMQAIRFRLFARRDHLRELAIEGHEDAESASYKYLESFINKTIAQMPGVGLASFLVYAAVTAQQRRASPEFLHFEEQASLELKEIRNKSTLDALMLMTVNSPVMVIMAAFVGAILWVAGIVNKIILFKNTESFVEDLRTAPA